MRLEQFFTQPRLRIVAGKGGVGKTTVTAVLARAAADVGLDVLVIDLEGRGELEALLGASTCRSDAAFAGHRWAHDEVEFVSADSRHGRGSIRGRTLLADRALSEYLHDNGLTTLARTMERTGLTQVITRGAPGMRDILILGKIKQLERAATCDVLLVDAPASGHAVTFLRAAGGLLEAVQVGAINHQATEVLDLLTDPARCEVILATLAEETPISEAVETAYSLEEEVGVRLGPIVVNAVLPPIDLPNADDTAAAIADAPGLDRSTADALSAAATFRRSRHELQLEQQRRLADSLPLPQLVLPQRFSPALGRADINALAASLRDSIEAL